MTAPSNANTSGLRDVGLSETYRFAYESIRNGAPGLSDATCAAIARSINMKVSLAANATASKIAELEAELSQANANGASHWSRATAAEARADRLADIVRRCVTALDASRSGGEYPDFEEWEKDARAALQQETQK